MRSLVNKIEGKQVKDLITKFFYKKNNLCFQILLHTNSADVVKYGEYFDYKQYKTAFNELQEARSRNDQIDLQHKNSTTESNIIKVA